MTSAYDILFYEIEYVDPETDITIYHKVDTISDVLAEIPRLLKQGKVIRGLASVPKDWL